MFKATKHIATIVLLALCASLPAISYAATGNESDLMKQAKSLTGYSNNKQHTKKMGENLWIQTLKEAANEVGYNIGIYEQGTKLQQIIRSHATELDRIWNFRPLMLANGRVIPPVIDESDDSMLLEENVLRIASQVFIVRKQAKVTSTAPDWSDYLLADKFTRPNLDEIDKGLLPVTPKDRKIWNEALQKGYIAGKHDALLTMIYRINSLRSEYLGMVRYHILRAYNMITEPLIVHQVFGVTGNGNKMRINDRKLQMHVKPKLIVNQDKWTGLPQIPNAFDEVMRKWNLH